MKNDIDEVFAYLGLSWSSLDLLMAHMVMVMVGYPPKLGGGAVGTATSCHVHWKEAQSNSRLSQWRRSPLTSGRRRNHPTVRKAHHRRKGAEGGPTSLPIGHHRYRSVMHEEVAPTSLAKEEEHGGTHRSGGGPNIKLS